MINNKIQEAYCSDEIIKLLLKHGFNVDSKLPIPPTHALAIEWIRVNFNILCGHTIPTKINDRLVYGGKIWLEDKDSIVIGSYDTPQEAIEAALLFTLKNLIP